MTKLHQVHDLHGRGDPTGGRLDRLVAQGIRGVTSNPAIIAKAIGGSADYDGQLAALAAQGHDAEALARKGKAAVAQAKLAYRLFRDRFGGPRWQALAARGAGVHRPL